MVPFVAPQRTLSLIFLNYTISPYILKEMPLYEDRLVQDDECETALIRRIGAIFSVELRTLETFAWLQFH